MNSFLRYTIVILFGALLLSSSVHSVLAVSAPVQLAQVTPTPGTVTPTPGTVTPTPGTVTPTPGTVTPTPSNSNTQILNPLGSSDITQFFLKIMQILILFAVPIIVFFIILSGFKYVMARGNAAQIETATRSLTWAVIGGVLILGAEIILQVIQGTVAALR